MRRTLLILLVALSVQACASTDRLATDSVSGLLDVALASRTQERQQEAFDKIVSLGCSAVPELAKHLDDSRPLPIQYLRVQNGPNHFEAFAQYSPETVTDVVATFLSVVTCKDFGFIANGGTAEERRSTIAGWKEYLSTTAPEQVCGCGG